MVSFFICRYSVLIEAITSMLYDLAAQILIIKTNHFLFIRTFLKK